MHCGRRSSLLARAVTEGGVAIVDPPALVADPIVAPDAVTRVYNPCVRLGYIAICVVRDL